MSDASDRGREGPGAQGRSPLPDVEHDVERIHRPIFREPRDPTEGREPVPWWLWTAAVLAIFWGGWYLGRYGGTFGAATHVAFGRPTEFVAEEAAEQRIETVVDPVAAGQAIYTQHCQPCHQPSGQGLPGAFPPVVGSEWVTGAPETVARILLHGLAGPVEVAGQTYAGIMPAWRDQLSDAEIAAVATFIRQWEPNDAAPVEADLVKDLRAETEPRTAPWTAEELRAEAGGDRPAEGGP